MKKQTLLVLIYLFAPFVYIAVIDGPGHGVSAITWLATLITYAIATHRLGGEQS
jgi:hypothetical protein